MKTEWLDAHAQLLSVPPAFDEATVAELGDEFAGRLAFGAGEASGDAFRELRLAGLIVRTRDGWRVVDPLRGELRRKLQRENDEIFQKVAGSLLDDAQNGLRSTLDRVLGVYGARVNVAVLRVASRPHDARAFDDLVDVVERGSHLGRHADSLSAAILLRQLPETPERGRQIEFLEALFDWYQGRRNQALEHFTRVLRSDDLDRAAAIAAHLAGVTLAAEGNAEAGTALLQRSVDVNRRLEHKRGLAVTLTSLGRVQRDLTLQLPFHATDYDEEGHDDSPRPSEVDERLEGAVRALEEAFLLGLELGDERISGVALLELAITYQRRGFTELAIELATEARQRIPRTDPTTVRAHVILGSLYKDTGDHEAAAQILEEGSRLASETSAPSLTLAGLFNVLASSERKRGKLENALRHARMSVQLGRELGNARHLSQALHTLATVLGDLAETEGEFVEAEQALEESEALLRALHDDRGRDLISRTRARMNERRRPGNAPPR
jgi:tetratricopeptide (TPR) repeat protein